ncbi:MAG TPA: isoprenylcysteine carboxylmethyltransferase family protein [Campylobacterales bacterium]|nr:isoprenylcysteine carboxylmethyltransferase family protein [Campylobacterales bacterium]
MINSKILVGIQFLMIFAILLPKSTIQLITWWWVLPLIASVTALWIFTHNRVGNFNITPEIRKDAKLIVTGPYRFVRHPMYSSLILFMVGVVLHWFSFLNVMFLIIMIFALSLKAFREEKLWHVNDDSYEDYKKRTTMIIPYIL